MSFLCACHFSIRFLTAAFSYCNDELCSSLYKAAVLTISNSRARVIIKLTDSFCIPSSICVSVSAGFEGAVPSVDVADGVGANGAKDGGVFNAGVPAIFCCPPYNPPDGCGVGGKGTFTGLTGPLCKPPVGESLADEDPVFCPKRPPPGNKDVGGFWPKKEPGDDG
jgi:hypothetical protein